MFVAGLTIGDVGAANSLVISNRGLLINSTNANLAFEGGSSNMAVVTGGSTWSNSGSLYVGHSGPFNSLVISGDSTGNGSHVLDTRGYVGFDAFAISNSAVVSGTNSIWNNSDFLTIGSASSFNSLVISNGGVVSDAGAFLGSSAGTYESALVTGPGSLWTNNGSLSIGSSGSFNSLVISNGGTVYDSSAYLGFKGETLYGVSNNTVLVIGPSGWVNSGDLTVGYASEFNRVIINGGTVGASNVYIGFFATDMGNTVTVTNGALGVQGTLDVRGGTLLLDSGQVDVGSMLVTNLFGLVEFVGGTLSSGATQINFSRLVVGDRTRQATYKLKGGIHGFFEGLTIQSNATLTGCGTVNGDVQVDPGGKVVVSCGGLTFNGTVTNNGAMAAFNRNVLAANGLVVNNGLIIFQEGATNFQGGFINQGRLINAGDTGIQSVGLSGTDFLVTIQSVAGLTYELQYTDSLNAPQPWPPAGQPQKGNGNAITLVDPGGATATQRFYQVVITGY